MFGIRDCKIIWASLYSSVGEINQDFQFCALNAKRGGNCIIVIVLCDTSVDDRAAHPVISFKLYVLIPMTT
jgi:hypothetical protein